MRRRSRCPARLAPPLVGADAPARKARGLVHPHGPGLETLGELYPAEDGLPDRVGEGGQALAHRLADLAGAVQRIHSSYGEPLKVEELAVLARLSEYQLARRIKALFGITPAQLMESLLHDLRIKYVEECKKG